MGPLPTTLALIGLVVVGIALGHQGGRADGKVSLVSLSGFVVLAVITAIGVYERVW